MDNMNAPHGMKPLTAEQVKQRRGRSLAIAWALVAVALLFAVVTYVRLGENMLKRHKPADAGAPQSELHLNKAPAAA